MDSAVTTRVAPQVGETTYRAAPSWWRLIAYGGPALPLALSEVPILLYLPAFYAKEVGLSTALVGLVFLLARVWDGLSDVLVGWLSDRSKSSFGRRKPWIVAGAPFLMAATWFLCNPPPHVGPMYLAVWAALFYTADTAIKIPHLSWGTELATGYVERSRVTAFRGTFSMLGNLLFVAAPLIFLTHDAPLGDVLLLISVTVLFLVPMTVIPIGLFVRDPPRVTHGKIYLWRELRCLAKDRVFTVFCLAILFYALSNSVINSLAVFSFGIGLNLPNGLFWIIFILYTSTLCAVPLTLYLSRRAEKHQLLAGGMIILAAVYAGHAVIPAGNLATVAALWIAAGFGNAAVFVLPASLLADMIDRGEMAQSERRSGAYMAVYNLVMKIGQALGVGLSFGLLSVVGYVPSAAQHSLTDVTNLRLLGFALPGLLLVPAICLISRHPITRKVHQQLRAEIEARNVAF